MLPNKLAAQHALTMCVVERVKEVHFYAEKEPTQPRWKNLLEIRIKINLPPTLLHPMAFELCPAMQSPSQGLGEGR